MFIFGGRAQPQKKNKYPHQTKHTLLLGPSDLRITARMVMLWFLVTVRYCFVVAEQPGTSCMIDFPYVKYFAKVMKSIIGLPEWLMVRLSGAYFHVDEKII